MIRTSFLAAAALAGTATIAAAGGYVAPVVEAEPAAPIVVAPVTPTLDWTGFYAGAQIGKVDGEIEGVDDYDGKHFGVHAGYLRDFGRFVGGAELSYDKLDDLEVDNSTIDGDGDLIRAKLLAGYDAGRILPYATIAVSHLDVDFNGFSDSETGFGYGVGVKFAVSPRFLVGAEWMRNDFEFSEAGTDFDIEADTFSINASYKF
ncbi:porin family protein [Paracoccus sp. Z118]|uniref:outer membrane protein n=1 Tax=Paracoccus sp. Z118 TaxID=2851017 RepID=UPI001C2B829B|nr:porin family protein [Paracoccus sp. Z118]MBV0890389.1 porin family protein [Paracoccus sp. Z118]